MKNVCRLVNPIVSVDRPAIAGQKPNVLVTEIPCLQEGCELWDNERQHCCFRSLEKNLMSVALSLQEIAKNIKPKE